VLLLLTELRFLPGIYRGAWYNSAVEGLELASSNSNSPSSDENTSSGNSSQPVNLDLLWEALPFTHAIKHGSHEHKEYMHASSSQHQVQQQQQQQQQLVQLLQQPAATAAASLAPQQAQQQQPMLAPLLQAVLSNADHPEIAVLASLVTEAVEAGITADEALAGYEQAFAAISAPAGTTWHLHKSTANSTWQQRQQKGAEYVDANDSSSSSSSRGLVSMHATGKEGLSAAHEQQRSMQATTAAQQLMTHALQLLKGTGRLADCGTEDDSLPPLLQQSNAGGSSGATGRVLLAAALQQSEEAMPNMVLQLVLVSSAGVAGGS
jgi:hypothetical protein